MEMEKLKNALKTAHQESQVYLQGGVRVNDSFWYHISKEYPGQIGIHLYATRVNRTIVGGRALLKTYTDGLNELAHRLETDPKLADINTITGWSKLVYENPKLLKRLGFEITERDEEKKEALAIMSREQFLTRPWIKVKTEIPTEKGRGIPNK